MGDHVSSPVFRAQLVRKLWVHLNSLESFGLSSPERIHRSGKPLGEIRRRELTNLLAVERQLHDLRRGNASLDQSGRLIKTAESRDIQSAKFSSFIEGVSDSKILDEALPDLNKMLEIASRIENYEALERLLRLQKIFLLAERGILGSHIESFNNAPLDRRWFHRWKLNACEISNGALQQLWARILIKELCNPGSTSLKVLEHLAYFSLEDAENLNRLATWSCGDFIYRSALQALPDSVDMALFENLEEQGLIRGVQGKVLSKTLISSSGSSFQHRLLIAGQCITISSSQARDELHVPAYLITRVGQELLSLVTVHADETYLDLILQDLQARGMVVQVSEISQDSAILQTG